MSGRFGIAVLGAVIAVVLQVVLAPNVAIMGTMPQFIIVYAVAISLVLPRDQVYIIVFVLGMVGDLLGYGPVGALSFILLIVALLIDFAQKTFGNGTLFVSCIIVVAFTIIVHFLHAAFMVAMTSTYTAADAFLLIAIPEALCDCVLAVLCYLAMRRLLSPGQAPMASVGPLS